jgi:DNA-binding LacI/PurR family transcriptional regulator
MNVRLKELAERAGVSLMTASRALRDQKDVSANTKAKIKLLAQEMGYVPDSGGRALRTNSTNLFGILVSSLTSPIFSRVVLALEERAHEMGYEVMVAQTLDKPEREETCIRRFLSRKVSGLFIVPAYRMATEARIYQEVLTRQVPTVVLGHTVPFCSGFVNVETDDVLASHAVTKHLLALGHTRIAFLTGPSATPWGEERLEGYRRALRESGIEPDDRLVFQGGRFIEEGQKAALQMIDEGCDATAVQAVNDATAVGCIDTFLNQGIKVPEDMSVAGFGNILMSQYCRVPLTTTRQAKYRLGMAAMDSMQQLLQGNRPESKRLPAPVVTRQSTGTPPATVPLKRLKKAATETVI